MDKAAGYYEYAKLRSAAIGPNATQAAINLLGEWFEHYGAPFWNGEYYDADDGMRLFPVCEHDSETDAWNILRYEFR